MNLPKNRFLSSGWLWACTLAVLTAPGFALAGDLFSEQLRSIDEKPTTLAPYRGKVLLIVNTASQCGYTPQYEGLQKLYQSHKAEGLEVLGFPSNDFGGQEPGSNAKIKLFCQGTYHVTFPMFEKGSVTGEKIQPLFARLLKEAEDHSPIKWNFEKFLIDRKGKVLKRFRSGAEPDSKELRQAIREALKN